MKPAPSIDIRVKVPTVPNFLMVGPTGKEISLPVSQISRRTLRKIAKAWTDALLMRSKVK